jgi:hypothetical protein
MQSPFVPCRLWIDHESEKEDRSPLALGVDRPAQIPPLAGYLGVGRIDVPGAGLWFLINREAADALPARTCESNTNTVVWFTPKHRSAIRTSKSLAYRENLTTTERRPR